METGKRLDAPVDFRDKLQRFTAKPFFTESVLAFVYN